MKRCTYNHIMRSASFFILAAILVSISNLPVYAEESSRSVAPDVKTCAVYNYAREDLEHTPTVYLWQLSKSSGEIVYRVYDGADEDAALLGSAKQQSRGLCCIIPLSAEGVSVDGGTLYITRQVSGELESERVAVRCPAAATPSVEFAVSLPSNNVQNGNALITQSSPGSRLPSPISLTPGRYYCLTVTLNNFPAIQSLTLPIKYDPEVLQLTALQPKTLNGNNGYTFGSAVDTGATGLFLPGFNLPNNNYSTASAPGNYEIGGWYPCGIGTYADLYNLGLKQDTSDSSSERQTPYVNTETGLIKLEFHDDQNVHAAEGSNRLVRIFFRCLETPETEEWEDVIHFASEADIPAEVTGRAQQYYYCTTSPHGYTAAIQSMNLLASPLSVNCGTVYTAAESPTLTAQQIYELPMSMDGANNLQTLLENQARIYNYTNYPTGGWVSNTLDKNTQDVFVLTPSNTINGAAKSGDIITVYDTDYNELGSATVNGDGGVVIPLGYQNLKAEGGHVFVTVKRTGLVESAYVSVDYAAEVSRDVYFKIYSTSTTGEDIPISSASDLTVKTGDQLRLDICFNNFSDLLSYTFNMSFNSGVVQVSDKNFHQLSGDGYITSDDIRLGYAGLEIGKDLSSLSLNDWLIYESWTSYENGTMTMDELKEIMKSLSIPDITEFEERYNSIAERIALQNAFGEDLKWNGGLLYTGPAREEGANGSGDPGRDEDSLYPYVDNLNGVLRFSMASLTNPPLTLRREGGYHFLSVYFSAIYNGAPDIRLSGTSGTRTDGAEKVGAGNGNSLVLSGPGSATDISASTVCVMPFTAHWTTSMLEETPETAIIRLSNGNAKEADNDPTAVYLYNGYGFRDPGFRLLDQNDQVLIDTQRGICSATVSRYYMEGETKHYIGTQESGAWSENEEIYDFIIPEGKYSESYELIYEYTFVNSEDETQSVTESRKIYVIYRRGDVNGDGEVNLFDEQFLQDGFGASVSDAVYLNKTHIERASLHDVLLGAAELTDEYAGMLAPSPRVPDSVTPKEDAFKLLLEFYAPNAGPGSTPLNPLALSAGQKVTAVVRYENLSTISPDGLYNMAFSIGYDSEYFKLNDFDVESGDAMLWNDTAKELNTKWLSELSTLATEASASSKPGSVYIQYVNVTEDFPAFGMDDETEEIVDSGILAAFSFTVRAEPFDASEGVMFGWLDYELTTMDADTAGDTLDRISLLSSENFAPPADVPVATVEVTGVTVKGQVGSYAPQRTATIALYAYVDGQIPEYYGEGRKLLDTTWMTTIGGASETQSTVRVTQPFEIGSVPDGTYLLVVDKPGNAHYVVTGIEVNGADVDLKESADPLISLMTLFVGDLDASGSVNFVDLGYLTSSQNYNMSTSAAELEISDINSDGNVNFVDLGILTGSDNYNGGDRIVHMGISE